MDLNTCDLALSSYLIASGCALKSYARDPKSQRVYFTLSNEEQDPHTLRELYFSGEATVNALKFAEQLKSLKALCHSII